MVYKRDLIRLLFVESFTNMCMALKWIRIEIQPHGIKNLHLDFLVLFYTQFHKHDPFAIEVVRFTLRLLSIA